MPELEMKVETSGVYGITHCEPSKIARLGEVRLKIKFKNEIDTARFLEVARAAILKEAKRMGHKATSVKTWAMTGEEARKRADRIWAKAKKA